MLRPDYPIRTPRLTLRPYRADDFDALYDIQSRPEVTRYLLFGARNRDAGRKSLRQRVAATELDDEGGSLILAVVLPETAAVIGDVVLFWRSREHRQGEIGYIFHPCLVGEGDTPAVAGVGVPLGFYQRA